MHAGEFVLENGELVDFAELVKERAKILLFHVPGNLTYEEFDGVVLLVWW